MMRRLRVVGVVGWFMIGGGILVPLFACCMGATIPYQDPTPEMAQQYDKEVAASDRLLYLGLALGLFLLVAGIGAVVGSATSRRRPSDREEQKR